MPTDVYEQPTARHLLLDDHVRLRTYECDGLTHHRVTPALVVLCESAADIRAVVGICVEAGVPFVARGSGTGLSGGALPHADGVLIVTSRMRGIGEIDIANQRVVVDPGVINLQVSRARSRTATITHRIPRASRSVPSAATWQRTPVGRTA